MRKTLLVVVCWLAMCGASWGDITIKGETKVGSNKIVDLTADGLSSKAKARWKVTSEGDSKPDVKRIGNRLLFTGPDGKYTVNLLVVDFQNEDFTEAEVEVTIGADGPVPPGPGPGPTPPPAPDAFTKSIQDAFASETDAGKAAHLASLAALYRQASADAFLSKSDTWGALFTAMKTAAGTLGVSGKLPAVQKVIQTELAAKLPTSSTKKLDADGRALATATFSRVATALAAVKTKAAPVKRKKVSR